MTFTFAALVARFINTPQSPLPPHSAIMSALGLSRYAASPNVSLTLFTSVTGNQLNDQNSCREPPEDYSHPRDLLPE